MEDNNTWSIIFLSFQRIPNSLQYLRKRMEHFLEKASHRIFLGQVNLPHEKLSGHLRSVNWWNESIYLFCKRPPPPIAPIALCYLLLLRQRQHSLSETASKIFRVSRKRLGEGITKVFWMSLRDVTTPAEKTHIVDVSEFCNPFVLQNNWTICGFRLVGWQVCPLVLYFDFLPNHVWRDAKRW